MEENRKDGCALTAPIRSDSTGSISSVLSVNKSDHPVQVDLFSDDLFFGNSFADANVLLNFSIKCRQDASDRIKTITRFVQSLISV